MFPLLLKSEFVLSWHVQASYLWERKQYLAEGLACMRAAHGYALDVSVTEGRHVFQSAIATAFN